jgi:hypothetical protein
VAGTDPLKNGLTIKQAAALLGVHPHIVRNRIRQVELMRNELKDWKDLVATRNEELRRKDHIIAALTERIPQLPASPAPSKTTQGETPQKYAPREELQPHSWWRRLFT